jgi:hypothetical protein
MHEPRRPGTGPLRRGAAFLASLAFVVGACSGAGATNVPTLPVGVPTVPPSGIASACLDASTVAIFDQFKATGADAPALLAANKDKLLASLSAMQPSDPATTTWRDTLVAAINSGDAQAVAAQIALASNGQVAIPAC